MSTGFTILELSIKPQVAEFVLLVEGGHETQPNRQGLLPSWLELDPRVSCLTQAQRKYEGSLRHTWGHTWIKTLRYETRDGFHAH